jgi:ubiquinone/menaquinone biosynthesis C-methylase UbiE
MGIIENYYLSNKEMLSNMVSLINPKNTDVVLDVGTGEGNTAMALAEGCKVKKVFAIDMDTERLKKFEEKLEVRKKEGIQFSDIEIKECSYEEMESAFKDIKFDIITCRAALHHFRSPETFLNLAYKLLKDDGKLNIMDPFFTEKTKFLWSSMAKIRESDLQNFYTLEEYLKMLENAKFQVVACLIFRFPREFNEWIKSLPTLDKNIPLRFKEVIKNMAENVKEELLIQEDEKGNLIWFYNCFELLAVKQPPPNQYLKIEKIKFKIENKINVK